MLVKMENKRLLVGYRKGDWQEVYYEPFARSAEKDKYKCPLVLLFHSARADHEANKNPLAEEVNWLPQYDPTNFEVLAKGQKDIHPWFLFRCWQYMGGATKKELNDNQFDRPNYVRWQIWKKAADKKLKRTKPSTLGEKRTAEEGGGDDDEDQFNGSSGPAAFDFNDTAVNGHAFESPTKKRRSEHGDNDNGPGLFVRTESNNPFEGGFDGPLNAGSNSKE